jgi:CarD family transcriptional regulator
MTDLPLSVGDRVVYPNQGLCTVTEIKTEEIAGQRLTFVSLVFAETGARVKVPQAKLTKNGVRRVSGSGDVKKVFDFLKSDGERASLDWKKRARDNTARLSEGGLLGLAGVVKELQVLSELRPLPPKERGQYNDARHLFVEELAVALGIPEADAEDALDVALFPPGKERPKRSIEEFQGLGGEDDELGLGGDLLGIDGEGAEASSDEPAAEEAEGGDDEDGEKPAAKKAPAKGKPAAAKARGKKSVVSDLEPTAPAGAALDEAPAPKKRGRPPKAKPAEAAEPAAPKKRGRPPKPKPAEAPPAKAKGKGKGKK